MCGNSLPVSDAAVQRALMDNLYRAVFPEQFKPPPQPKDLLNPLAEPMRNPERVLDLEEHAAEPPGVTIPDLDL